jgi:hypothetical protein
MSDLTDALADGALASENVTSQAISGIDDSFSLTEAFSLFVIPGSVGGDVFKLTESFLFEFQRNALMQEVLRLQDRYRFALLAALSESVTLSDAYVAYVNHLLAQACKLSGSFVPTFIYNLSAQERVSLVSLLDLHNAASISEAFQAQDASALQFIGGSQIVELLRVTADLGTNLVLRIALKETMDVEDDALLNFIYSGEITETIVAEILYQSPDGSITSWAINTRTGAITEYRNFSFNSYASIGRKYIAADSSGLYELNGAQDLTSSVLADVMGGFMQFNGSKFAGLKGVYIGAQGQGNYLLKLITGDGIERVYRSMLNPGLMTTKVNIGKGLRARYFAWELLNEDGQDFDLDEIEFVPMMSGRRV